MPANNVDSPDMAANGMGAADADPYAPTTWGVRYEDLKCPSGQTCQIRKVGIEQLIADGAIDDIDSLSRFVSEKHIEQKAKVVKKGRSGNPAIAAKQAAKNGGMLSGVSADDLRRMFRLMDQVTMAAVVSPRLYPSVSEDEREVGRVYISDVDVLDKSYIMNYVLAGVKDLESFRKQLAENAAALGDVEDLEVPTERDSATD